MAARTGGQVYGATQVGGNPRFGFSGGDPVSSRVARTRNLDYRNEGKKVLRDTGIILGVDGSSRNNGSDRRL